MGVWPTGMQWYLQSRFRESVSFSCFFSFRIVSLLISFHVFSFCFISLSALIHLRRGWLMCTSRFRSVYRSIENSKLSTCLQSVVTYITKKETLEVEWKQHISPDHAYRSQIANGLIRWFLSLAKNQASRYLLVPAFRVVVNS